MVVPYPVKGIWRVIIVCNKDGFTLKVVYHCKGYVSLEFSALTAVSISAWLASGSLCVLSLSCPFLCRVEVVGLQNDLRPILQLACGGLFTSVAFGTPEITTCPPPNDETTPRRNSLSFLVWRKFTR